MKKKSGYLINTFHRRLLEKAIKQHAHLVTGNVLDIGSLNRRYDHLFGAKITAIDIKPDDEHDVIFGDIQNGLSYADNSFDNIICFEVIEYLDQPQKAISEIYRLLKKDGFALISYPFMYREHQDKTRLTEPMFCSLLSKFSSFSSFHIGNGYIVLSDILRFKIFKIKNKFLKYASLALVMPVFLTVKIFKLEQKKDEFYSGLFFIIQK